MRGKTIQAHAVALFTIFIWGTTFVATKILLSHFSPIEILVVRFVLGYTALSAASLPGVIARKTKTAGNWRQELYFAAAGLTGVTLYFLMENIALTYTLASNVGIIVAISPLFAVLLATVFLKEEKVSPRFFIGFAAAISGIVLVSLNGAAILRLNPSGDILAAGAAIVWAFYSIIQKKIQPFGYSVIAVTRKTFFYGLLFMIPAAAVMGFHPDMTAFLDPEVLLPLCYLGLGASALCFTTWNFALHALGAAKASAYIYLVPFVNIIFAALILKEAITPAALGGAFLILFGLYLSERSSGMIPVKKQPVQIDAPAASGDCPDEPEIQE